jgi:hypothetical protein
MHSSKIMQVTHLILLEVRKMIFNNRYFCHDHDNMIIAKHVWNSYYCKWIFRYSLRTKVTSGVKLKLKVIWYRITEKRYFIKDEISCHRAKYCIWECLYNTSWHICMKEVRYCILVFLNGQKKKKLLNSYWKQKCIRSLELHIYYNVNPFKSLLLVTKILNKS